MATGSPSAKFSKRPRRDNHSGYTAMPTQSSSDRAFGLRSLNLRESSSSPRGQFCRKLCLRNVSALFDRVIMRCIPPCKPSGFGIAVPDSHFEMRRNVDRPAGPSKACLPSVIQQPTYRFRRTPIHRRADEIRDRVLREHETASSASRGGFAPNEQRNVKRLNPAIAFIGVSLFDARTY